MAMDVYSICLQFYRHLDNFCLFLVCNGICSRWYWVLWKVASSNRQKCFWNGFSKNALCSASLLIHFRLFVLDWNPTYYRFIINFWLCSCTDVHIWICSRLWISPYHWRMCWRTFFISHSEVKTKFYSQLIKKERIFFSLIGVLVQAVS